MSAFFMMFWLIVGCIRPTGEYEVKLYNGGTALDEILPPGEPMGGQIEVARYRMHGSNLGLGHTALFGDTPTVDGLAFVVGFADFGTPNNAGYDRQSSFFAPGARDVGLQDVCVTRIDADGYPAVSEYVDVGDAITLTASDGDVLRLPRDPSSHPRPAGESFYASWGGQLMPALTDHPFHPDTWRSDSVWGLSFPGTIVPPESSMGSVPYPLSGGTIRFPPDVSGLTLDDVPVRAPHHDYDDDGLYTGERDEVRFPGPFERPVHLGWAPSATGEPLTVALRYLGAGDPDALEGDGSVVLGELVCTVPDDGSFVLEPDALELLNLAVRPGDVEGAVLFVGRMVEDTIAVPDVLSRDGLRIPFGPVRTRTLDLVVTRLDLPEGGL